MNKIRRFLGGLTSTAAAAVLLVGLPVALIVTVGNPLPASLPGVDQVRWHLSNGRIPDAFWFGLFALVLWFVWFQLIVAFAVEVAAILRGVSTPALAGFGAAQSLVGPLVGRAALVVAMLGTTPAGVGALSLPTALAEAADTTAADSTLLDAGVTATGVTAMGFAGVAADQARVDSGVVPVIEVTKRDTLRTLAETHLGSAGSWKDLRDANIGRVMVDGTVLQSGSVQIKAGWRLLLPGGAAGVTRNLVQHDTTSTTATQADQDDAAKASTDTVAGTATAVDKQSVTVVETDHFWSLAESQLIEAWGRVPSDAELTPYWAQMVEANADRLLPPEDPNLIYPGQEFVVPSTPADPFAAPSLSLSAEIPLTVTVAQDKGPTPPTGPVEIPADVVAPGEKPATQTQVVETPVVEVAAGLVADTDGDPGHDLLNGDLAKKIVLGTIGAFTLGLLVLTLKRLGKRRGAARTAGADRQVMRPRIERVEDQVRALSDDGEAARYVTALNPYLSHTLTDTGFLPSIIAVRAGAHGVEVLLDEPCEMPKEFVQISDSGSAWRLVSDISHRDMENAAKNTEPYCPGLIPVGDTASGELLLDFEQLGAVSVTGPVEVRDGFLREIVVAAMAAPWTVNCDIVVIGVPGIHPAPGSRITVPENPTIWAESKAKTVTRDAKDTGSSPYEARVKDAVEGYPTIVVVGSGFAAVAQHLAAPAMLARSSLILVAGSELATESRIVLSDTTGVMEPSGLVWQLRVVDDIDLTMVDELLSDAQTKPSESDEFEVTVPVPQPEQTSPSPQILAAIEKIMAPCGVEVKVLRSTPVVEGAKLTAKPTAVTAYIALHPGVSAKTVKSVFWGEDKTRAAENAFTKIRNLLGDTPAGERRFEKGTEFTLRDVGSDWQRFNALVEAANSTESVVDQAAALDMALGLIGGEPAKSVQGVLWSWFTDDRRWYETVDALIIDAASMRAKLALEADDPVAARCALRSGQSGMPSSEALKGLSFIATKALDGDKNLDTEYLEALADAEACGYDLTPGTHALYNALRSQPDLRVVSDLKSEPVRSVGS